MSAHQRQPVYECGEWEVDLARRELRAGGSPVPIGQRAFDIIAVMVQSAGGLITKNDFMDRVWPGRVVEDNALQVHISAVRKALGSGRRMLRTEFGRGYRLLGDWKIHQEVSNQPINGFPEPSQFVRPYLTNLPAASSQLIGRALSVQHLENLLSAYRAVTLVGAGGIGKTVLALDVVRRLFPDFQGDALLVELAALSDPALVPSATAGVLGLGLGGEQITARSVARAIGGRRLLLLLDNCEHVIDAAATLTEEVVRLCPQTTVLATSREPLRFEGEYIYRVPPLAVPPQQAETPDEILEHGAVQLLAARMRASHSNFIVHDKDIPAMAAICRRLDGIPLAIEFAAARAATLGLQQVASRLDDRFGLLTSGHRTALPRHQTLRAALDWSYRLLSQPEQRLLRHLAVFVAGFTLDGAAAVMADADGFALDILDDISNLVSKSLVVVEESKTVSRWRLLETIRAYALEKLTDNGEAEDAARRHAGFFRDLIGRTPKFEADLESLTRGAPEIENVRAALNWAFSPSGDTQLGLSLTADYVPVWLHLSLMTECRDRVAHALDRLGPDSERNARVRMQLHIALGVVMQHTTGPVERTEKDLTKALEIAESLDDLEYQLLALWALWFYRLNKGEPRLGQSLAERFSEVARRTGASGDRFFDDRLMGNSLHFRGNQREARRYFEHILARYDVPSGVLRSVWFLYDMRIAVQLVLARVLLLQGQVDQAMTHAQASLEHARAADHKLSVCYTIAWAVFPIELMTGDFVAAERSVATLIDIATRQSFSYWTNIGHCLEGELLIKRGHYGTGTPTLRAALGSYIGTGWATRYSEFLGVLAEGVAGLGQINEALTLIDDALAWSDRTDEAYYAPELLRLKGEMLLREAEDRSVLAGEECFHRALAQAREQGALFWELQVALSLARLCKQQHRENEARQVLAPVCDRFPDGADIADLRSARELLASLSC